MVKSLMIKHMDKPSFSFSSEDTDMTEALLSLSHIIPNRKAVIK
jgi:hypothetical protein